MTFSPSSSGAEKRTPTRFFTLLPVAVPRHHYAVHDGSITVWRNATPRCATLARPRWWRDSGERKAAPREVGDVVGTPERYFSGAHQAPTRARGRENALWASFGRAVAIMAPALSVTSAMADTPPSRGALAQRPAPHTVGDSCLIELAQNEPRLDDLARLLTVRCKFSYDSRCMSSLLPYGTTSPSDARRALLWQSPSIHRLNPRSYTLHRHSATSRA
jgi:hypothetical protein